MRSKGKTLSGRLGKSQKSGLRGMDEVIRNLNRELTKKKLQSARGLLMCASFIRRDMDRIPPRIPVDTGHLRASWYARLGRSARRTYVSMGFTASYAVFVHERQWKRGKRPGSGPKFFESAMRRNKAKLLAILASQMKQKR